jgi:hypothetical protein
VTEKKVEKEIEKVEVIEDEEILEVKAKFIIGTYVLIYIRIYVYLHIYICTPFAYVYVYVYIYTFRLMYINVRLCIGDSIEANYKGKGRWYPGVISAQNGGMYIYIYLYLYMYIYTHVYVGIYKINGM